MMRPPIPAYYEVLPLLQSFDSRIIEDDDAAGNLSTFYSQKSRRKPARKKF